MSQTDEGKCTCDWEAEDRGGGLNELIAIYNPACPVHSDHLFDPRSNSWVHRPSDHVDGDVAASLIEMVVRPAMERVEKEARDRGATYARLDELVDAAVDALTSGLPCALCPDGHSDPTTRPWGVYVAPRTDGDGQPTHLVVQPANGAHVAEADAEWLREGW